MAGGTWSKLVGKERPGTYINFETTETNIVGTNPRGTVILPLLGYPYGPAEKFITINNSAPDANYSELGYSVYEKPLLLVKECLKKAKTVIVYIPAQGATASARFASMKRPRLLPRPMRSLRSTPERKTILPAALSRSAAPLAR